MRRRGFNFVTGAELDIVRQIKVILVKSNYLLLVTNNIDIDFVPSVIKYALFSPLLFIAAQWTR